MRESRGIYLLAIGLILLQLSKQQYASSPRWKRAVICVMACYRAQTGNPHLAGAEKDLKVYGCNCKTDGLASRRSMRSLKEFKPKGSDVQLQTVPPSNGTTAMEISSSPPPNTVSLPGVALPGAPSIRVVDEKMDCSYRPDDSYNGSYFASNVTVPAIVNFLKSENSDWYANVTWQPLEEEVSKLNSYLVMWTVETDIDEDGFPRTRCKLVSKNFSSMALNESDGWRYPQLLWLRILPLPRKTTNGRLEGFYPETGKLIPVPPPKDAGKLTLTIAGGLSVGVVFILLLVALMYKHRCKPSSDTFHEECLAIHDPDKKINFTKTNQDLYFATYYQESQKYTETVATVVSILRNDGYNVIMDQFESTEISDLGFWRWSDNQIKNAKKILVFCSPGYMKLWRALGNGEAPEDLDDKDVLRVRYEIKRIGDMYAEKLSTANIICINMDKKAKLGSDLPPWMKHNILLWPDQKDETYRRLIDQRAMVPLA